MPFERLFSDDVPLSPEATSSPSSLFLRNDHAERLRLAGIATDAQSVHAMKPTANHILDNGGPEALEQYLEENPNSARRLQSDLRGSTLLGREASPPKLKTNTVSKPAAEQLLDSGQ